MHPYKSAGSDDFNPAFFFSQNFWSLLGKEVFECCCGWLKEGSMPAELNATNLVLIPKKDNIEKMADLRPIALCNVLYKVLSEGLDE